jgi:hypothetical protein
LHLEEKQFSPKPRSAHRFASITRSLTMALDEWMNFLAWKLSELLTHPIRQISTPATFGCLMIFQERERTGICKALKKSGRRFKNYGTKPFWRIFKWYLNHGPIDCLRSAGTGENTSLDELFPFWLCHSQRKIGRRSHWFLATLWSVTGLEVVRKATKIGE